MHIRVTVRSIVVTALLVASDPATAQYDRDGRYVPSPNGVPSDPSARPIPMDAGTPGTAIGSPSLPRNQKPPPPTVLAPTPALPIQPGTDRLTRYRVPPAKDPVECASGWSRATGISQRDFSRLCKHPAR